MSRASAKLLCGGVGMRRVRRDIRREYRRVRGYHLRWRVGFLAARYLRGDRLRWVREVYWEGLTGPRVPPFGRRDGR